MDNADSPGIKFNYKGGDAIVRGEHGLVGWMVYHFILSKKTVESTNQQIYL